MQNSLICRVCGSPTLSPVDTYKHTWYTCLECGNVRRERKSKYAMEYLFSSKFIGRISKGTLQAELFHVDAVVEDESLFYRYYADDVNTGTYVDAWKEPLQAKFAAFFDRHGITVKAATILDVSGGPGLLTRHLASLGADATVSEFSEEAVTAMREGLGVQAVKYDYNSDDLTACVDKKFDVVLIEYSLNFCNDLRKFATEVYEVVKPGGIVYATVVPPTLGTSLRWEFDEYTYNNLYVPESVASAFASAGFVEIERSTDGEYPYTQGSDWSGVWGLVRRFWANHYRRKIRRSATLNRELLQKNRVLVFQKDSPRQG